MSSSVLKLQPLVVGNWKMNGVSASLRQAELIAEGSDGRAARVAICPPFTLIARMVDALRGAPLLVGGQNHHWDRSGAHTGDISAEMLADAGAAMVILGHSERRQGYGETDQIVSRKVLAALRAGLEPIVCVAGNLEARAAGDAVAGLAPQIRATLPAEFGGRPACVAYDPAWTRRAGLSPTLTHIEEAHRAIRAALVQVFGDTGQGVPVVYGGPVTPLNAAGILRTHGVGGVLVGCSSLSADDFLSIVRAATTSTVPPSFRVSPDGAP
jgi:triosephosphate isomerase